ncbi:hypothetical protein WN943_013605 [Citrus x changshan-huyou]
MDKIDRKISELKLAFEVECKEHKEFKEAMLGFIGSYARHLYNDCPTGRSYADLSYDQLMAELEIANVRELEDFLINDAYLWYNLQQEGM